MLHKFSVKNFRNFADWLRFDLSSQQYEFNANAVKGGVIQHAMIYGPNGGGKSNLGLAMVDPAHHLVDSPNFPPKLESNYLNAQQSCSHAEFVFEFTFNNSKVVYRYGKESPTTLVYEQLEINDHTVLNIDRRKSTKAQINVKGAEHLKTDVGDSKISLVKYLLANTILDEDEESNVIKVFADYIKGMVFFRSLDATPRGEYSGQDIGVKRLSEEVIARDSVSDFNQFLNDAGIECKLCVETAGNDQKRICFDFGNKTLEFAHAASTGTLALGVFYYWWLRLRDKEITFAYMDEFDAFYHHALASQIVEKVSHADCQTIMTTHNTGVMNNDLLRPDCYFVLDKDLKPITAMTEKELRKAHNLEKIYKGFSS